ncbi:hypothetical protein ABT282_07325 [Streptomyces sp. NPDC000927]|uniref:hypothetical protein n=1 Tax=Streptomyces sp. NPDC000927 TaxID=3154371 RepID=UPI003317648B
MKGVDPMGILVGDVVEAAWDEDPSSKSCHCAFRVEVSAGSDRPVSSDLVRVISHDLRRGDIVRKVFDNEDEGECHCDYYFLVERSG